MLLNYVNLWSMGFTEDLSNKKKNTRSSEVWTKKGHVILDCSDIRDIVVLLLSNGLQSVNSYYKFRCSCNRFPRYDTKAWLLTAQQYIQVIFVVLFDLENPGS